MTLQTLLNGFADIRDDLDITGLSVDSRLLLPGQVFIAIAVDGQSSARYIEQAIARGASAVIVDSKDRALLVGNTVPMVVINNLVAVYGLLAARFYGQPSMQLDVIGITGTNGKTSCSQFLGQLLDNCGIIGTLGWGAWGDLTYTGYTTPDALMTQEILTELVAQGKQTVAMEVSSHGLAEGRVNGVQFKGVVLTNISRDHLDFHGSMTAYIATKQQLFTRTEAQFAVINLNDALSESFISVIPEHVVIWGFQTVTASETPDVLSSACHQQVIARNIRHQADGLAFELSWQTQMRDLHVPLYGSFNVDNILTVITVMLALGHPLDEVIARLQRLQPVDGRMQRFGHPQSALIFVDYAHTPDALEKALNSAREHCTRQLWVVFGCGGDRDTGKRALMGACAGQLADQIIITDDNPRSENPTDITAAIMSGCSLPAVSLSAIKIIHDRALAIQTAITHASPEDCIVIAGKGHEQYQEIGAQKIPFSDAQVVTDCLAELAMTA